MRHTGTPHQGGHNLALPNLLCLCLWKHPGSLGGCASQGLLGDAREFKAEYVRPITAGADKHATERARSVGAGRAAELRARFAPFFLRREKAQVLERGGRCVE